MVRKESPIELEELPLSPAAQEAIHEIAHTPYVSHLRQFSGSVLTRMVRDGEITIGEMADISSEREARRTSLTMPKHAIPEDIPEPPSSQEPWSPTALLDSMPTYEIDGRARAAGEAVIRQEQ